MPNPFPSSHPGPSHPSANCLEHGAGFCLNSTLRASSLTFLLQQREQQGPHGTDEKTEGQRGTVAPDLSLRHEGPRERTFTRVPSPGSSSPRIPANGQPSRMDLGFRQELGSRVSRKVSNQGDYQGGLGEPGVSGDAAPTLHDWGAGEASPAGLMGAPEARPGCHSLCLCQRLQ
ncbi:hypothetical protein H1C71_017952 [Ictidomys tridecemlineatus]|nr:hypothetical protein H1C71_017952 [Ictidomys tridecemlineatus]